MTTGKRKYPTQNKDTALVQNDKTNFLSFFYLSPYAELPVSPFSENQIKKVSLMINEIFSFMNSLICVRK